MPIIFRGTHRCECCKRSYQWVYFELTRSLLSSGHITVEKIPSEPKVRHAEPLGNGKYRVEINCPECSEYNIFEYFEYSEDEE